MLYLLLQTKETAKTITDAAGGILDLGVPGILLIFLGLVLFFGWKVMNKLVVRLETKDQYIIDLIAKKDGEISLLKTQYANKVEQLMERIVETNSQLVLALEKQNTVSESLEKALKANEDLLTEYRAELEALRRAR